MMQDQQIKKECFFCKNNIDEIDYKDSQALRRFINNRAKIISARRTGTCSRHQRKLAETIKRARHMALLPFVVR